MTDIEIKERAKEEENRILDILNEIGISDKRMRVLEPIIVNTSWIKAKLDDAREAIKNCNVVIAYDNGGGQKGIRENPLFKGYESLFKSYMSGMDRILNCLPAEQIETETKVVIEQPKTMLELMREKHKREA